MVERIHTGAGRFIQPCVLIGCALLQFVIICPCRRDWASKGTLCFELRARCIARTRHCAPVLLMPVMHHLVQARHLLRHDLGFAAPREDRAFAAVLKGDDPGR